MKIFLKILIASLIAGTWHQIDNESAGVAIVLFLFVLAVLLMNPVKFQSPEKREEYIEKIRKQKEQKLAIIQKQKEERARLKKEKQDREAQEQKEFHARMKNRS
ncbi:MULTISPECIES: hypothetical protein [Helicobacter]|uniref:Integral membrane protein n=2 Tax=Helicobacter TaxID=209 RepID=A0A377J3Q4_9HELI|nr:MULTISPECIES: hypothetical protein [Helicobacter]MDL0080669.1 hypothetical protein [Helicobacter sp. CPD2-1]MDL0082608.1 hypothetical protein [Helicobacter sp. XJK30-2]STO97132.1 integral membrane protein [Helicobacter canis]